MFLLIDKPKGITSHDVVHQLRKITGIKKIGHAGTLDPNATGLLVVGIGRESTKKLGIIAKNTTKSYVAEIFLGEERDTEDSEGRSLPNPHYQNSNKVKINKPQIIDILTSFLGKQMQVPPIYSAIKMKGRKAYELARKGENVKMEPREVEIHSIKILDYEHPILTFETKVSAGTYIRSLARDIGRKLGTGAYLRKLRRTEVGDYSITNAVVLDKLTGDNWKQFDSKINL
jgi:tRNA pseudouridine55 synthase